MNNLEKKKIVTFKSFAKIFGIVFGGFLGVFAITIGIMFLAGSFNESKIKPTNIAFQNLEEKMVQDSNGVSYYSPEIVSEDEEGNLKIADYFYLDLNAVNEDVTEKQISLSVSNNDVVKLESNIANLGEPIKIIICKDENGIPYGGYTSITARSNSGINGVAKLDIFIDVPVNSLEISSTKTSNNPTSLFINEEMVLNEPIFLPAKSKNPSKVSEGSSNIVKADKQYVYKIEYKVVTQMGETWVDLDGSDSLSLAQNKVVVWADTNKTTLRAVKKGEFKVTAYAFDTYEEQEKYVEAESEADKLLRMRAQSEEMYFTVTEVDYQSISSSTLSPSYVLPLEYKKYGIKVYLRTSKTASELEAENAVNLNLQIDPNPNYGITAQDLYARVQSIYVTTDLDRQGDKIRINGRSVEDEFGNTLIYPYFNEFDEYEEESLKEYYYTIDVIGKETGNFNLIFNVVNPNDGQVLSYNTKAKIIEIETDVFEFTKPDDLSNVGQFEKLSMTQINGEKVLNLTIDATKENYIDLTKFIVNESNLGVPPTYDKVVYYVYLGNSDADCNTNLPRVNTIIDLQGVGTNFKKIKTGVYCLELKDGLLVPISYGEILVYAVLVQTDINGTDLIYSVTNDYTYKVAELNINIDVKLNEVQLTVLDTEFEALDETELKESYNYNVRITPLINGKTAPNDLILANKDKLKFVFSSNCVIPNGIITFNEEQDYYYLPIMVPELTVDNPPMIQIECYLVEDGQDVYLGETYEFDIKSTAVKRLTINNNDFYHFKASWNGSLNKVVWQNLSNGEVLRDGKLKITVTIDGENKNYEVTSSDSSVITPITEGGETYIKLLKPSEDIITITATSSSNIQVYDEIQVKLDSEKVTFLMADSSLMVDPTTGDVMKNGQVYSQQVHKGDEVDLKELINVVCGGEENCYGMLSYTFETPVNFATFSKESGKEATVIFTRNVSTSENATVVITSAFGDVMRYRFIISNYITISLNENVLYNEYFNSVATNKYQNQSIMSLYNDAEYVTFVVNQNNPSAISNTLVFKNLLNIQPESVRNDSTLSYIVKGLNDGNRYITIDKNSSTIGLRQNAKKLLEPTLVSIEVQEKYGEDENEELIFSQSFSILLVPNLFTESIHKDNGKVVYLAGKYAFATDKLEPNYSFGVGENLEINLNEIFVARDFAGEIIESTPVISLAKSYYSARIEKINNKETLIVEKDKVFTDTPISINVLFTLGAIEYSYTEDININAYYKIKLREIDINEPLHTIVTSEENSIQMYAMQDIKFEDIIVVEHDESEIIKESLTYNILSGSEYIRLYEATSINARIIALGYSNGIYAKVNFKFGSENDTGFVLQVKVVNDVDSTFYGVAPEYQNTLKMFDDDDNLINIYDKDGKQIINVYDKKGNLTSIYDKDGKVKAEVYDVNGNLINLYNNSNNLAYANIYDFNGNLIDLRVANVEQTINNKYINIYGKDGNLIDIYDSNNNLIKSITKVDSNSSISIRNIFIAKKLSNNDNDVALTYSISDPSIAYIDGVNKLHFNPCASAKQVTIIAYPADMQGVEKLVCTFEVIPSQNLTITYKYAENDISQMNQSLYAIDETAIGFKGYMELKPGDKVYLKDYITATNKVNGQYIDIFNQLTFVIQEYDAVNNVWINSNLYTIVNMSTNQPFIQPLATYTNPVITRIKMSSTGGLLGYFNVLLATNATVNMEGNITITQSYPLANSSNYYGDNLTYECVMPGVGAINLTSYDVGAQNIRRIYAEFGRANVTSSLIFRYEAHYLDGTAYNGAGISLDGSIITITDECETGVAIHIYMHNSYQEFTNTYNIYVGGNTSIRFMNNLTGEGESAYNSYFAYNASSNQVRFNELFTVTTLSGESINLKGENVFIGVSLTDKEDFTSGDVRNNINGKDYVFVTVLKNNERLAIDNYANQNGQIVFINIKVIDENGNETTATYRLKIFPNDVKFTNNGSEVNSQSTPYYVNCSDNTIIYTIYKDKNNETIDLINSNLLISNSGGNNYSIGDITLLCDSNLIEITSENGVLSFKVAKQVEEETEVVINVVTTWGRSKPFYVHILPTNRLSVVGSTNLNVYSLTDLELFNNSKDSYVKIEQINSTTSTYETQNYNKDNIVVEAYLLNESGERVGDNLIDNDSIDALIQIDNNGVLSFGAVSTSLAIVVDVYYLGKKDYTLQTLNVVILPNFNSADIMVNVGESENSISNPILLTDNGFCLSDLIEINRFVVDNISNSDLHISFIRYPSYQTSSKSLSDILKAFRYSSNELEIDANLNVTVKDDYVSSTNTIATIELRLFDDVLFKTFYCLIEANYAFMPVNDFLQAYAGEPLDLSYVTDYFVASNGEKIIGGTLSFEIIDDLDGSLVSIIDNKLVVNNNLTEEIYATLLAIYNADNKTYLGSLDLLLEPTYTLKTNVDNIMSVKGIVFGANNNVDGETIRITNLDGQEKQILESDFISKYFTLYENGNKVNFSDALTYTLENTTHAQGSSGKTLTKVTLSASANINNTSVLVAQNSIYFEVINTTSEYIYSEYENPNVYIAGDSINLLNCVGEFYDNENEYIEPYSVSSYEFVLLDTDDSGAIIENGILNTTFSIYTRSYTILLVMYALDGKYYSATFDIVVQPSVLVSMSYTNPAQNLTILTANTTINIKDYINFAPQRASVRGAVLSNTTYAYDLYIYKEDGTLVTNPSDISGICSLSGLVNGSAYSSVTPKLNIKVGADGYFIVLKPKMSFGSDELYDYYFIKVNGVNYSFTANAVMPTFGLYDELTLADFGAFTNLNVSNVVFTSVSEYYEVNNNAITSTHNLYDMQVEILITADYTNSYNVVRKLYATATFNLKTKYIIEQKIISDVTVVRFDTLAKIDDKNEKIDILSSTYINVNSFEKLNTIRLDLFNTSGVRVLNIYQTYDYLISNAKEGNKYEKEYLCLYTKLNEHNYNGVYITNAFNNDTIVNITNYYAVLQFEFNSGSQYKYLQYTINFVNKLSNANISYKDDNNNSIEVVVDANNAANNGNGFDLSELTIELDAGENNKIVITNENVSEYEIQYKVSNENYLYIKDVNGKHYLCANPSFTPKMSSLLVIVYHIEGGSKVFMGQGKIDITITPVSIANNQTEVEVSGDGKINNTTSIQFIPNLCIGDNTFNGNVQLGSINSLVYNEAGTNITGNYSDYLVFENGSLTFSRDTTKPINENISVIVYRDIKLLDNNANVVDSKRFSFVFNLKKTRSQLLVQSDGFVSGNVLNLGYLEDEHVINANSLNQEFNISFVNDFNTQISNITLTLLTTTLSGALTISNNKITVKALYENAVASILATAQNKYVTVINLIFGDYQDFVNQNLNIEALNVGETLNILEGEDVVIAFNEQTHAVVNTNNVLNKVANNVFEITAPKYIICVKSKTGIIIDGHELYSVGLYKTLEMPADYDIKIDGNSSATIDVLTTGYAKSIELGLYINGSLIPSNEVDYELVDLNKLNNATNSYAVSIGNNEPYISNGTIVITPNDRYKQSEFITKQKFVVLAHYNGVTYSKEFIINCRKAFMEPTTYSYQFDLTNSFKNGYVWQDVLSLSDFSLALNVDDVSKISYSTPFDNNTNLYFDATIDGGYIYARVPTLDVLYNGNSAIYSSNGYTETINIDAAYNWGSGFNNFYSLSRLKFIINILPLSSDCYPNSADYRAQDSFEYADNLTLNVSYENKGSYTNILVNNKVINVINGNVSSVTFTDATPVTLYSDFYTFSNNKYRFSNQDMISDNLNLAFRLCATVTIDAQTVDYYYYLNFDDLYEIKDETFLDCDDIFKNENLLQSINGVVLLTPITYNNQSINVEVFKGLSEIVSNYGSLSGYEVEFVNVDSGSYVINQNVVTIYNFANTGITYLKAVAKKTISNVVVDTIEFYLPIIHLGTSEGGLQYLVKDNNDLYNALKDFDNENQEEELVDLIVNIVQSNDIEIKRLDNLNSSLIFSVRLNHEDATICNLVATYIILEIRGEGYSYHTIATYQSIIDSSAISLDNYVDSTSETIVSVEILNNDNVFILKDGNGNTISNYSSINLGANNVYLYVPPIFKNKVITLAIKTQSNGVNRYYNIDLTVKAVNKYDISLNFATVNNTIYKGTTYTLPIPTIASGLGVNASWSIVSLDSNVTLNANTIYVSQNATTHLQNFLVYLTLSSSYGEYTYEYYINVVDTKVGASYTQTTSSMISGSNIEISTLGHWDLSINGESRSLDEVKANYNISYEYSLVTLPDALYPAYSLSGEGNSMLKSTLSIVDYFVVIACNITIQDKVYLDKQYVFTTNIYVNIQSGVEFISGTYTVSQTRNICIISSYAQKGAAVSALSLLTYTPDLINSDLTGLIIEDYNNLKVVTVSTTASGTKAVEIDVRDTLNNVKRIKFEIIVNTNTKQFFSYIEPTNTITIYSGSSKTFTKDVNDIGTFKLLETAIENTTISEAILNQNDNYDFALSYLGDLLTINNKTIYASDVLNPTTVTIQVTLYDITNEYVGYMMVDIAPRYKFEKLNTNMVYAAMPNSIVDIGDLVKTSKLVNSGNSYAEITDYESEGIEIHIEFENGNVPSNYSSTGNVYYGDNIMLSYNDAGKVFKVKLYFTKGDEVRVVDYVITVGDLIHNLETKNDVYNLYSKQSINLSKLKYNFYDKQGYLINIDSSELSFEEIWWCSELYERYISGYNGTRVNVKYDDCNPFGMIAGDFGEIASLSKHTSETASNSTIVAFNVLSELFVTFMGNFEIPTDGTEYIPAISSDALDNYTQFYNKAIELYNSSLVSFTKNISNNLTRSAVIGINHPYTMSFDAGVSPELIDFQTVIANLFGFSSKSDFMNYAQDLANAYAEYRTNIANHAATNKTLENGCFYTSNGSFVFPIAIKNELSSAVLAYVILDTSGFVSVWVNDITAALWATNFNASYHTNSIINNKLYCKNILFVTGPQYYSIEGNILTAKEVFSPVVTNFVVKYVNEQNILFKGNVQLIINTTYEINIGDSFSIYAGKKSPIAFEIKDVYRHTDAHNDFNYYLIIDNKVNKWESVNGVKGLNIELGHLYANKVVNAKFAVTNINTQYENGDTINLNNLDAYYVKDIQISVIQSRFLSLASSSISFDPQIVSGRKLIDASIIKLIDENGNNINLVPTEFKVECIEGSGVLSEDNGMYKYQTEVTESITIRITDRLSNQYVDYECMVRAS